jgi:hypothetical protein
MFTDVDDPKNHVKNRLRQACNNVHMGTNEIDVVYGIIKGLGCSRN